MSLENNKRFSEVEKKILSYLLEHAIASAYELAKNIGHSYSTVHVTTKKLAKENLLFLTRVKSEKGGRKILFSLSSEGKELFLYPSALSCIIDAVKESVPRPLDDVMVDFLLSQKRESAEIDFKLTLDTRKDSSFPKICKDIFAMSNYGGGYLLFGFQETRGCIDTVGVPSDFDFEQAHVQEKFNSYSNEPLVIDYHVVTRNINGQDRNFAVMHIPASTKVLLPKKGGLYLDEDGKQKKAFSKNDILIRRGTQSVPASEKEIDFIRSRSQETDYKIGLLKGKPDEISENLFGNFFEVTQVPTVVFEAKLPENIKFALSEIKQTPFVRRKETIYSFFDVNIQPLGKYIQKGSLCKYAFQDFLKTPDLKAILKQLLDLEIRRAAINIGLRFDYKDKNVYFYPSDFQERLVSWEGRSRKSTRYVVRKIFLQQENTSVFVHSAASLSFRFLGTEVYLEILPKIVLTYDGVNPINDSREGRVKTRLTYNQFNDAYLNHVLFWASRFKTENLLKLGFGERILVCSQPVNVTIDVGIRSDRPSIEFSRRRDELYSVEEMEVF